MQYIHLRVRSSYSLLEGAIQPNKIIELCQKHKMPAVAVTDNNNLFASLEFSNSAIKSGVQPIIGSLLKISVEDQDNIIHFYTMPVFVMNKKGYDNLLKIMQICYLQSKNQSISIQDILQYNEGLILLTGAYDSYLYNLVKAKEDVSTHIKELKNTFDNRLFIEIIRNDESDFLEDEIIDLAYKYNIPLVATNDVYFATKNIHDAHDAMLCVANQTYVVVKERKKVSQECYFKNQEQMIRLFSDLPEAIENTSIIAKKCCFYIQTHSPLLPHFAIEGLTEDQALTKLATEGLQKKFHEYNIQEQDKYLQRLEYEINIITQMNFSGYFLIVSDFIMWSKKNDIPVGPGRGSGVGSVVAWSLGITDLDPINFGLIFERFLNPERISMPDFDVDFCQNKRDKVIEYVQKKYGHDKVAQIITFGKLQPRAVLRDIGRVLQLPYSQVDRISKMIPNNPANPCTLQEALSLEPELKKMYKNDNQIRELIDKSMKLEGLNRHCSTHAAGVVITDRPVGSLIPIYSDLSSDMQITQYSMKYAEMSGLVKFDFLGLKTLTVIKSAVDILKEYNINLDINMISLEDKKTYSLLQTGNTNGIFQLESKGMQDAIKKMQVDSIYELTALISLYRPGPMDNLPLYIDCKHGRQPINYPHPKLEELLKETYGVIIYQEQVLKIAQILAGYTLGGADILRRAMGKKIKSEMDQQRTIFIKGSIENGIEEKKANEIFDLVAKFAGYGFNKSHAAAYAFISYQTAYLKANHKLAFFVASMNLEINDTDKLLVFCNDAKKFDIKILNISINESLPCFSIANIDNNEIIYGLAALKNVGQLMAEKIIEERNKNGKFQDIFDFFERCDVKDMNKRQFEYLIKSGAFDCLNINRNSLLQNIDLLFQYGTLLNNNKNNNQVSLFDSTTERPQLKIVEELNQIELAYNEIDAFGFILNNHPLQYYKDKISALNIVSSNNFDNLKNIKSAGIVLSKKIMNSNRGKYAFVKISDCDGEYDIAIFDNELLANVMDIISSREVIVIDSISKNNRIVANNITLIDSYSGNNQSTNNNISSENHNNDINININTKDKQIIDNIINTEEVYITINYEKIISLKKILDNELSQGSTSIFVRIIQDNQNVDLLLSQKYSITEHYVNEIGKISSIYLKDSK